MTRGLDRQAAFIRRYYEEYPKLEKLARLAETYVRLLLEDLRLDLHLLSSRAKSPSSAQEKIRRKSYGNPGRQITDKIGVRVITYYGRDVDPVVDRLRDALEIDRRNSVDKRHALGVREFGYRSVQLVARVPERGLRRLEFAALRGLWFEIQVRSILEHAWAEIEHQVVYKAGTRYPDAVLRRFAAIAGALEILEAEFLHLRSERANLVNAYRAAYTLGKERRQPFDAARLMGFLESAWPDGLSWREAERAGAPFPPRIEVTCVEALGAVRLNTAESLGRAMKSPGFRRAVRSFAASQGIEVQHVSHLALVLTAVARKNARLFQAYFPDFVGIGHPGPRRVQRLG
jgi:ppGpp synthetase/RelA/SpoT-type nucleotidyltranferase